jgi:hypothetical protein
MMSSSRDGATPYDASAHQDEVWRRISAAGEALTPSCWHCRAPLGSTEDCLTCAAKRAEDRAKGI